MRRVDAHESSGRSSGDTVPLPVRPCTNDMGGCTRCAGDGQRKPLPDDR